ncbi:helix-turn-helix transcriptional regulator [Bacillus sp. Hm123]|uniref:helix-turn-helix transcriptional regulator n=1 Tax=Bacillus sp. Hm123 TaxID=3450745 RepID=UPI003F426241
MVKVNNKQRLLKLMEWFREETDESNEWTIDDIISKFQVFYGEEYKPNKNSLKDDIENLIEANFDITINQEKEGMPKYYSHQYRLFEPYELRMLIDAVVSARFITKEETKGLTRKIQTLTSQPQAKRLQNELLIDTSIKSESRSVRLAINDLHEAITEKRIVTFQYGRYNLDKQFMLSHDGALYKVKPLALTWAHDFYYLIAYYFEADEIRHYRIDRMRNVQATEESFTYEAFDVGKYVQSTFNMFAGQADWIKIRFKNELVNVIIDKFGHGVDIQKDGEEYFILSTKAIVSTGLVNWILNFGSQAEVVQPNALRDRVQQEVEKMYHLYIAEKEKAVD